jgi:phosphomannomutase
MDRLQGTDGIRRDVRRQDDPSLAGLSPWEAFVERGVITEAFLEGYAYAFARLRLAAAASREIVVGWDPRDPSGAFTGAVVRGVRKAGATAAVMGVAPTPAVPMYMTRRGAAAGLMVTASHNPAAQNGVKIFLSPAGLKLLPEDDRELTAAVRELDWDAVREAPLSGGEVDGRAEWRPVFDAFHLAPANAWLDAGAAPLRDFIVVVDPARGSYSGVAADVLKAFGARVHEVNTADAEGRVNWRSGVADLEGVSSITFGDLAPGGRFGEYPALGKLEELQRKNDTALASGEALLAAAVFDADGDRFFLVVYDPTLGPNERSKGEYIVLSGDEVAILQAEHLAAARGDAVRDYLFVNTVESDLGLQGAAGALGFQPLLKPVGDKWILEEAWRVAEGKRRAADVLFAVGCEETGHAITFGDLETRDGRVVPFAAGNGLKAALNTLAAVARLKKELPPAALYERVRAPFERGYKGNNYVFFTKKDELLAGGAAFDYMDREIEGAAARRAPALRWERLRFEEEPDLLYWAGYDGTAQAVGVFCRNSGTEDKSALYVRATARWAEAAREMEEDLYPAFYAAVKDEADPRGRAELAWLAGGPRPADEAVRRVAEEVERVRGPASRTARGERVWTELRRVNKI